ncbi:hypothetical protein D3C84_1233140 [compost metagenome]
MFADLRDTLTPFIRTAFGLNHFAAGNIHLAAGRLCNRCIMLLVFRVAGEPVAPFRLTRNIEIEEVDMRAPSTVFDIHSWL